MIVKSVGNKSGNKIFIIQSIDRKMDFEDIARAKDLDFDELLTVRILLREMPSTRINFFYEIYNERGDLLNTGMTQLGFIHSDSRRPCRCPEWFLELIRSRWTE